MVILAALPQHVLCLCVSTQTRGHTIYNLIKWTAPIWILRRSANTSFSAVHDNTRTHAYTRGSAHQQNDNEFKDGYLEDGHLLIVCNQSSPIVSPSQPPVNCLLAAREMRFHTWVFSLWKFMKSCKWNYVGWTTMSRCSVIVRYRILAGFCFCQFSRFKFKCATELPRSPSLSSHLLSVVSLWSQCQCNFCSFVIWCNTLKSTCQNIKTW